MNSVKKKWEHKEIYAPRLRILLDPVYIQAANLVSSSTYQKYKKLVAELVSRGHYVYWMLPDVEYEPDAIESHPNVGVIRTSYIQDQFLVDGLVNEEYFNLFGRISGKYHIDAIVTGRTGAANMLRRVLEAPRFHDYGRPYTDKHYGLPMVVIEEFPQTKENQFVGDAYWIAQCSGYMSSDSTIFISDHNRSEVVAGMNALYRPKVISSWLDRCTVIPSGIEIAELDKYYQEDRWKSEKGFKVLSVGRLMSSSLTNFHKWFRTLYESGVDTQIIVSLSGRLGGPMRSRLSKLGVDFSPSQPFYKLIENNARSNFLKMLRTVHAGICPLPHMDCPVGLSEAIYMGVPVIMPYSDYQETFYKEYPFVIDPSKKEDLLAKLIFIKDNPEESRKMLAPWRDYLRRTFDAPTNNARIADTIEHAARKDLSRFKTSGAILGFLEELKGEKYTFEEIVGYLQSCGVFGISIGNLNIRATWTYGRGTIHHSMRYAGYVDICTEDKEVFVRRDVFEEKYKG